MGGRAERDSPYLGRRVCCVENYRRARSCRIGVRAQERRGHADSSGELHSQGWLKGNDSARRQQNCHNRRRRAYRQAPNSNIVQL